jgi:hypothetical protein
MSWYPARVFGYVCKEEEICCKNGGNRKSNNATKERADNPILRTVRDLRRTRARNCKPDRHQDDHENHYGFSGADDKSSKTCHERPPNACGDDWWLNQIPAATPFAWVNAQAQEMR